MEIFSNGGVISEEEYKKCQQEIVSILSKYSKDLRTAKAIIKTIDLDEFSELKVDK